MTKTICQVYFQGILLQMFVFSLTLCETLMTYDKLCIIQKRKSFLLNFNFSVIAFIIVFTSILTKIPDFFQFIVISNSNGAYETVKTFFGESLYFTVYEYLYKLLWAVLISVCYTILLIKTIINLKEFLDRKRRITNGIIKIGEKNMVKIIIWIEKLRIFSMVVYLIRYCCYQIIMKDLLKDINHINFLHFVIIFMEILIILTFNLATFVIFRYHKTLRHLIICRKTYK